jgi:hypothetical protein
VKLISKITAVPNATRSPNTRTGTIGPIAREAKPAMVVRSEKRTGVATASMVW